MLTPILLLALTRIAPPADVPYRQPQLAALHGKVAMTFGSGSSIFYAASPDGGRSFPAPVKVAEVAALALGRHRGPRLAILEDALVITAVAGEKPGQPGTLMTFRSTDSGKTWTRGGVVNDVADSAREGLHAMTAAPDGTLFVAWLDLRSLAPRPPHAAGTQGHQQPQRRTGGTQLYGARSSDGGRTWSKNVVVYISPDGTICQCCHPSLAAGEDGRIVAMWRNALGGFRDMYVSSSTDGVHFNQAAKLGEGTWKLDACPMDGGGVAASREGVISAWRREGDIFLADAGRPERRIGSGKDPALARGRGGAFVVWTGKDGAIQVLRPGAAASQSLGEGGFASLAALQDGSVVAAWEGKTGIEVVRLD